jgi:hypothetical protein
MVTKLTIELVEMDKKAKRRDGHLALARDGDRAVRRADRGDLGGDLANRYGRGADAAGAEPSFVHVGDVHGATLALA